MSKNNAERLPGGSADGTSKTSREGAGNTRATLDIATCSGGQHMPENTGTVSRSDSTSNSQQQNPAGNWQGIGSLAAAIVAKAVAK